MKNQKGITLIALIITIIVMLILVGVTINVALNGGLFSKAEEATTKTKIAQVQEALTIKKAEIIAEKKGVVSEYNLSINDLTLANELKNEFSDKLIIGKDGILYYNSAVVTNEDEQSIFESMGIQAYEGQNTGDSYTFTLGELVVMEGAQYSAPFWGIPSQNFWGDTVSEELKNSTMERELPGSTYSYTTYNITCSDSNYTNIFDLEDASGPVNAYALVLDGATVMFMMTNENGESITTENYTNYSNLKFTISMSNEPQVTSKAYLNSDGEYYYVFYSNGIMKAINVSSGGALYKIKYEDRGEQTLTVNGETKTYTNALYMEGTTLSGTSIVGDGTFKFAGYFDGSEYYGLLNNRLNDDGSWSGDWETCTLDETVDFN